MRSILAMVGLGWFIGCASGAPPKAKNAEVIRPARASGAPRVATVSPEGNKDLPPLDFLKPTEIRGSGRCVHDFDCYDTTGFPASGQRWECVKRKCVAEALSGYGEASTGMPTEAKPPKRATKRRRSRSSR
jgi:hypothetical protein